MEVDLLLAKEIYNGIQTRRNLGAEYGDIQPFEDVLRGELHVVAHEATLIIGRMFQQTSTRRDEERLDVIRNTWFGVAVVAQINGDEIVAGEVCRILVDAVFGESRETINDLASEAQKRGKNNLGLT